MNFETLYSSVRDLLKGGHLEEVKTTLKEENPVHISQLIRLLPIVEQGPVFRLLPKDLAIDVFEQLNVEEKQILLRSFQEEKAIEMLSHLDPDDQVELLDELPAKVAKRLLANLSPEERQDIATLMGYPVDTAGRIMTPEYVSLRDNMTVQNALDKIRKVSPEKETIYYCYVTDDTRNLKGVVSLKDLVINNPDVSISAIMETDLVVSQTHDDQEQVARMIQDHDLLAVPVVDREKRLVGIVTVDDAMDIIQEEATEDIFLKAGLGHIQSADIARSFDLVKGSVPKALRARLPYLAITFVGGLLAGGVIGAFEEALQSVVFLAFFIPVIMDMGGNVGTQSSTIFTRGLLLGHINMNQFFHQMWRETKVGASMGFMLGILGGIFAVIWQGFIEIGYVVGLSLFFTITLATIVGFVVPYTLTKLGLDQAAGADPIITTIKDMTGLVIYFATASFFLGHLF